MKSDNDCVLFLYLSMTFDILSFRNKKQSITFGILSVLKLKWPMSFSIWGYVVPIYMRHFISSNCNILIKQDLSNVNNES